MHLETLYTYLLSQSDYGDNYALDGLLTVAAPPGTYILVGDAIAQAAEAGLIAPAEEPPGWRPTDLGEQVFHRHVQTEQQTPTGEPCHSTK